MVIRSVKSQRGFSLIELLVGLALGSLVLSYLLSTAGVTVRLFSHLSTRAHADVIFRKLAHTIDRPLSNQQLLPQIQSLFILAPEEFMRLRAGSGSIGRETTPDPESDVMLTLDPRVEEIGEVLAGETDCSRIVVCSAVPTPQEYWLGIGVDGTTIVRSRARHAATDERCPTAEELKNLEILEISNQLWPWRRLRSAAPCLGNLRFLIPLTELSAIYLDLDHQLQRISFLRGGRQPFERSTPQLKITKFKLQTTSSQEIELRLTFTDLYGNNFESTKSWFKTLTQFNQLDLFL